MATRDTRGGDARQRAYRDAALDPEGDLRRLADEQAALRRVATAVASGASPLEVFDTVAHEVGRLLAIPIVVMFRYDSDQAVTVLGGAGDTPYEVGTQVVLDGPSVTEAVLRTGRPARIDDWSDVESTMANAARQVGVESVVGVPILTAGGTWGLIAAASTHGSLPPDTEARLSSFTSLIATSLSNGEAQAKLQRFVDEQAALRRVATLVARQAPPAEIFVSVAEEARHALDLPIIAIARYEADDSFVIVGATGEDHPFRTGSRFDMEPGVSQRIRETGRPARVDYDQLRGSVAEAAQQAGIGTALGVPIVVDGELWGTISALSTVDRPLPGDAEARLVEFTELVGTAISNAEAREGLRRLAEEQEALRRVAVLVAQGAAPEEVFAVVAQEVGRLLDVPAISMVRFEHDGTSTAIAVWGDGNPFGVGATFEPWPGVMQTVRETQRPARLEDFAFSTGPTTARLLAARIHSGIGVPVNVEGRVWGTIIALATGGASIPGGIEPRLLAFTELVGTALSNADAQEGLRRLADEQAALRRVATLVAEEVPAEQIFAAVAQEVSHVLGIPLVEVSRYENDRTYTVIGAWGDHPFRVGTRWEVVEDLTAGIVLKTGRPARIDNYTDRSEAIAKVASEAGVRSIVAVPILDGRKVWGAIAVARRDGEILPDDTEARLGQFTELVATAVSNAQTRDELRRFAVQERALNKVATLVARGADSPAVFDAICEETGQLLGASSVNLCRFTADGFNLTMAGWSLRDTHVATGTRLPLEGETINVLVQRTGAPGRVESYEGAGGELAALLRERGILSEVGAPVVVEGKVWGVLIAGWDTPGSPAPGIEHRLARFSDLVATAVSNAEARADLQSLAAEQAALRQVATLVAQAADSRTVFDAVCEQTGKLFGARRVTLSRFTSDGYRVAAAGWGLDGADVSETRVVLEDDSIETLIRRTASPGRSGLTAAEDRFRTLVERVPLVTYVRGLSLLEANNYASPQVQAVLGYSPEEWETDLHLLQNVLHPEDREYMFAAARRMRESGAPFSLEYRMIARDGHVVWVYDRTHLVHGPDGRPLGVQGILLDITAQREGHPRPTTLTDDERARRIAESEARFRAIIENEWIWAEDARGELTHTSPAVYEMLGYMYEGGAGELAARLRRFDIRSEVGAPVIVDGQVWGALIAGNEEREPFALGAELRLARFAELVATAIANATTRAELVASRARIVAAGDAARRRIERNLHDGTQQRLVALGLDLQSVRAGLSSEDREAEARLTRINGEIEAVLEEVRELSRGLHPALLSQAGLQPSLRALARKSPVPVELSVDINERPAESVEIAVYFVVSEALANAAKHARASAISVAVETNAAGIQATIEDDGVGGAYATTGSGLIGLTDRVEALGGRLVLDSPPGDGTRISIDLPLVAHESSDHPA